MKIIFKFSFFYLAIFLILIVFYPFFMNTENLTPQVEKILLSPSLVSFFGTDSLGRDLFSRLILGARLSFFMGIVCSLISFIIGFIIGSISGLQGGWIDQLIMRTVEILMSLPQMVTIGFALLFFGKIHLFGSEWASILGLIFSISLGSWMSFARMVRSQISKEKELPYVEAARALGASPQRLVFQHILPNILPSLVVLLGLQLPNFLLFEGLLSFVGLGVQPPTASWGSLLHEGWKTLSAYPHLLLFPSGLLFLTIFSVNVVFDQYRLRLFRKMGAVEQHH